MEVLRELPQYVSSSVVQYIMPKKFGRCEKIVFHKLSRDCGSHLEDSNYNLRYELAYDEFGHSLEKFYSQTEDDAVTTSLHLSRVAEKNGRNRYYLTFHEFGSKCRSCGSKTGFCGVSNCNANISTTSKFLSRYIGKNLEEAIVTFLLFPETKCHCNKCIIKRVNARGKSVWKEFSSLGKPFWYNMLTKVSQWENPNFWYDQRLWHNLSWKTFRKIKAIKSEEE